MQLLEDDIIEYDNMKLIRIVNKLMGSSNTYNNMRILNNTTKI